MSVEKIMVNGHELTAFDLPSEPSETYTVSVDGLGEIVVEKGKPPKEKDIPAMYMRKLVPELCEQNAALFRENSKLRELVRRYGEYTDQDRCEGCVCKFRCNDGDIEECWQLTEIRELACELGVEVNT
jgi:hypothetical protein